MNEFNKNALYHFTLSLCFINFCGHDDNNGILLALLTCFYEQKLQKLYKHSWLQAKISVTPFFLHSFNGIFLADHLLFFW